MSDLRIPNFAGAVQAPDFLSGQSMILDALDKIRKQRLAEEQAATQDARAQAYLANQQATARHHMQRDAISQQRADANDKKIAAQGRHTWQNDVNAGMKNGVLPPGARIEMRDPDVPAGSDPWQATSMPATSIQGASFDLGGSVDDVLAGGDASLGPDPEAQPEQPQLPPPPKQRKILVADYEGTPQEFDMSAMEEQKDAEIQDQISKLEQLKNDPGTPPENVINIQHQIIALKSKMSKEGFRAMSATSMQDQKSTDKLMLQNDKQEGDMEKETLRQDRMDGRAKKALSGKGPAAGSPGSSFSRLKPSAQATTANMVGRQIRDEFRASNWFKFTGPGEARLRLARENIRAKGKGAGAQHMEAMMNFFGYIRGGVPAENETKEFKSMTTDLTARLDKAGRAIGIDSLGSGYRSGAISDDEFAKSYSQMPEAQRHSLETAIEASIRFVDEEQDKVLTSLSESFNRYPPAGKEIATDFMNSYRRGVGLSPTQYWPEIKVTSNMATDKVDEKSGGKKRGVSNDDKAFLKGFLSQ